MCITEYDEAETLNAIGNERFAEGKLEGKAEGKTEGIAIGKAEGQAERDAAYKAQLSKMVNAGIVSEEAAQQLLDIGELAKCKFFFPPPPTLPIFVLPVPMGEYSEMYKEETYNILKTTYI